MVCDLEYIQEIVCEYDGSSIVSGSIIGSMATSNAKRKKERDIDVVVLFENLEELIPFEFYLNRMLNSSEINCMVSQGWGVVSPRALGRATVHLLLDTEKTYMKRSVLFRSSAAKYLAIMGKSLSCYAPKNDITVDDLVSGYDGIEHMVSCIESCECKIKKWCLVGSHVLCVEMNNEYATKVDECFYAVFKCVNNISEFYRVSIGSDDLYLKWCSLDGPQKLLYLEIIKFSFLEDPCSAISFDDLRSKCLLFLKGMKDMF